MKYRKWIDALWELFFPRLCVVCDTKLAEGEEVICALCNLRLPRTNLHQCKNNYVEKLFWGKFHIERATSFFYYQKGSAYNRLIHRLKYYGGKELAEKMGRLVASELKRDGFFTDIDLLIPVPLHPVREKQRGYNQSEWIIRGISQVTGIPYRTDLVQRTVNTEKQVRQSVFDRMENTKEAFEWRNYDSLLDVHVLLVDDVLTTGSTLSTCLMAIQERKNVRFSILTLCSAH